MPEHRRDPTTGLWCLLSTERAHRPAGFGRRTPAASDEATCPFCPGHEAATPPALVTVGDGKGGWDLRCFPNKYPALRVEGGGQARAEGPFDQAEGIGAHEVIVESSEHGRPLWQQPGRQAAVLRLAAARLADLRKDQRLRRFVWFRNRGPRAGASQPHPHSQVLASSQVGGLHAAMAEASAQWLAQRGRPLLDDIVQHELDQGVRVVARSAGAVAVTAYAPRMPFEVWVVPRDGGPTLAGAELAAVDAVGEALETVLEALDVALDRPDHNVVLYTAPRGHEAGFRWHLRVLPRVAGWGGYELATGGAMIHVSPEEAARVLRSGGHV